MDKSDFVIMVNVGMQKGYSLSSEQNNKFEDKVNEKQYSNKRTGYTPIPGLLPTVPQQQNNAKLGNEKSQTNNTNIISGSQGYQLTRVDVAVYLEETKATAGAQANIERLIRETVPETTNCYDCIRFETMRFTKNGDSQTETYKELLSRIEELEQERIEAQKQISNWKFDQLETELASAQDARTEWEAQARRRENLQHLQDSTRMANLEAFEKLQRAKQDSIIKETTLKLDTSIHGRIESESKTKDDLIDLLKLQINNGPMPDDLEEGLLGMKKSQTRGPSTIFYFLIGILILAMSTGIVYLLSNKKKIQPVYLKPKKKTEPTEQKGTKEEGKKPEEQKLSSTLADENEDVMRAEIKSMRQEAVSMSVGQKEGATTIVSDWLEDAPASGNNQNDKTSNEDK
jgi:hypothetical protein